MKYQLGEVEVPTIVANHYGDSGCIGVDYRLEFDSPPDVRIGQTYRTRYSPLSISCDSGYFLALWRDGNTLYVRAFNGWTPTNGHVLAPGIEWLP